MQWRAMQATHSRERGQPVSTNKKAKKTHNHNETHKEKHSDKQKTTNNAKDKKNNKILIFS